MCIKESFANCYTLHRLTKDERYDMMVINLLENLETPSFIFPFNFVHQAYIISNLLKKIMNHEISITKCNIRQIQLIFSSINQLVRHGSSKNRR